MRIFEDKVISSVPLHLFKKNMDVLMLCAWGGDVVKIELGERQEDEVYMISKELFSRLNLKIAEAIIDDLSEDELKELKGILR